MKTLDICPQHIFEFTANEILTQEIEALVKAENYELNSTNYLSSNKDLLGKTEYAKLTEWFNSCVEKVRETYSYKCDKLAISQMWANKAEHGNWHHPHLHPFSIISAIFYITDSPAVTWFSIDNFWIANYKNLPLPLAEDFKGNPYIVHKEPSVKGKLLLFPSHLLHGVSEHKGDSPRYTISFNTFPAGLVGNCKKLASVVIPN